VRRTVGFIILVVVTSITTCERVEQKQVSESVLQELRDNFFFREAVELAEKYSNRSKTKEWFEARSHVFGFGGSERQNEATVDGYHFLEQSHLIGISLHFYGEQEILVMLYVTIHPSAEQQALDLIKQSLDSVDATGYSSSREARLYFLGTYPLSASKVMKILVRKDGTSNGAVYSINYGISAT
jgi:hypothetical protein